MIHQNYTTHRFLIKAKYAFLLLFTISTIHKSTAQGNIECATQIFSNDYLTLFPYQVKDGYTYMCYWQLGQDANLPLINAIPNTVSTTDYLLYIAIFDPNCNQVFGSYYGGSDNDYPYDVDIDAAGNILISGYTRSADFPTTDGTVHNGTFANNFLLKFAPDGTLLFSTLYGGGHEDFQYMAVDDTDIYTFGGTQSPNFPTTDGTTYAGWSDFTLTKHDGNGNLLYATVWGGSEYERTGGIATLNGGVVLAGETRSSDFPTTDGSTNAGDRDISLTYLDAGGNIVFSKIFGGIGIERWNDLVVDGNHIYVAGISFSTDFPTTDGTSSNGTGSSYLAKFDLQGNIVYSTIIGSDVGDVYGDLKVQDGMAYLVTQVRSTGFPVVNGNDYAGQYDVGLTKYDPSGNIIFSTHFGGADRDRPGEIVLNAAGEIFMVMHTDEGLPTTNGVANTDEGLAFVKFNSDGSLCSSTVYEGSPEWPQNFSDATMELSGDTLTVAWPSYWDGLTTDGSVHGYATNTAYVARYVFCPTPTAVPSDILTPSTFNVCQNGVVGQISGEEIIIDGTTFPTLYREGVPENQHDFVAGYQWQTANAPGGPWTDIPGSVAQQQNYSPAPTTVNVYYRRLATPGDCCSGAIISTSNVVSVLVTGDVAPTVDAGGSFYNCASTATTIGGSPAATGGTAPYTYNWNDSTFLVENPTVSPTESTIYTLFVTDDNGCVQADQASVSIYNADAGADKGLCDGLNASTTIGGSPLAGVTIVPSGGTPPAGAYSIEYAWSPATGLSCTDCPNPTATPASTTDYTLTVTLNYPNGTSCTSSDMVLVEVITAPMNGNFAGSDRVLCLGEESLLGGAAEVLNAATISSVTQTSVGGGTATTANLADGNFSTGGHTADGHTMTIDLGSIQTINIIRLAALAGFANDDYYDIELSIDNVNFTSIGISTYVNETAITTKSFAAQDARYVRLRSIFSSRDVSVSEFSASYEFNYIWTPGAYIISNSSYATFDAGNLEMPELNPITYTATANLGTCNFYDQVTVAVIEARADDDGCGPRTVGEPDRTPNIDETYSWSIIADPSITTGTGSFLGATDEPIVPVSASVGGNVGYELTVSYTLNGSTGICRDTVIVPPNCGLGGCDIVTADGNCPSFDSGNPTLIGIPPDGVPENWTYSWTSNEGMVGLDNYTSQQVNLIDIVTRTFTVTFTNILDPSYTLSCSIEANSASFSTPVINPVGGLTCLGTSINIGDPANNPGLKYKWTNPTLLDDPMSNYPLATVSNTTMFNIIATDTITGCRAIDSLEVVVLTGADAGPDLTVCDNGTVTIGVNRDTVRYNYSWEPAGADWQNGTDETDAMPDVYVATPQSFILTAVDTSGTCTTTDTVMVNVETFPPSFTIPDTTFCPGQGVDLVLGSNQVPAGYIYSWSPASFFSDHTLQYPTIRWFNLPNISTTFTVEVRTAGGCNQMGTQTINPLVTPPSVIENQTVCVGESIAIGDAGNPTGAGITYSWSPTTDLDDPTSPNPIYTPSTARTRDFTLTKTDNGCSIEAEVSITSVQVTVPTLSPQTICQGNEVQMSVTEDQALSYQWSPATNLDNPYIANPTFSGTTSTAYTLTVLDAYGCSAETSTSITVNSAPAPDISLSDTSVCLSSTTVLNASVSPAGTYAYFWTPTDYLSNANDLNPTFYVPGDGDYTFNLAVIDQSTGCSKDADMTVSATNRCPVGVGNLVFIDLDNDGIFNNNDIGVDHIDVWLFKVGDNPAVDFPVATTTTSGGGYYLFGNIDNGEYFLHIPSRAFDTGNPLNDMFSSTPEGTDNSQDDNADENGQNTLVAGGISSTTIDLQPDSEPTGEAGSGIYTGSLDDDDVNLTVDFGLFTCKANACGTVTIQINN